MNFHLEEEIHFISSTLGVPIQTVDRFIDGTLGTRWIEEYKLDCSEVELSSTLKTIRKRLSYDFRNRFTIALGSKNKKRALDALIKKYRKFDNLHEEFAANKIRIEKIEEILVKNKTIIDSGISGDRFFEILPHLLKNVTPYELNLCFNINTLLRWRIACFLQSIVKEGLYVRGSLIFLNSRPFGYGYFANFPQEKNTKLDDYYFLQGSDLDIRIKQGRSLAKIGSLTLPYARRIQDEFKTKHSFITIEIASISSKSNDDVWSVRDASIFFDLITNYQKGFNYKAKSLVRKKLHDKQNSIDMIKRGSSKISQDGKVMLSNKNIRNLIASLEKSLLYLKAHDDLVIQLKSRWEETLIKGKRETDFFGFVKIGWLFEALNVLFFTSGYRFSDRELKKIFKNLLNEYENITKE